MTARQHHYLSQCYLKGFTIGNSKKSKLTVIDLKERKKFETIPKKVGSVRDFNRVEIESIDPNVIETALADFESKVATALQHVQETLKFDRENKNIILNFIALLAVRSPQERAHLRQLRLQVSERILDLFLATKERFNSQITQMKSNGYASIDDIAYEGIKNFHERKAYTLKVPTAQLITMETIGQDVILKFLHKRYWFLIQATNESGPFITSDHPVILTGNEPDNIPLLFRNHPGFGSNNTQVYFPLSQKLALLGDFDGKDGMIKGTKELVATLNSDILRYAYVQIYTPIIGFHYMGKENRILDGNEFLRVIGAQL